MNLIRTILVIATLTATSIAADPPALRKPDAKRILEAMDWREVTIVTVQQGINGKGQVAPIFATVVALGVRDSKQQQILQTMFYDEDYGWFFYELGEKSARLWTKDGYREFKPWNTW